MFGGYTAVPWTSAGGGTCVRVCVSVCTHVCVSSVYKPDPHAFIFTLTNKAGLPAYKAKATKPQYAVYHFSACLPRFGGGPYDLSICSNAHTEAKSGTKWGTSYPLPPGATRDFLVGGKYFKVEAVEVFLVQ